MAKGLTKIVDEEVRESAIELIEQVVSIYKMYPDTFKGNRDVVQQYKFARGAANRFEYSTLAEEYKRLIDELHQIAL